jgi:RHS repeat-associated protein
MGGMWFGGAWLASVRAGGPCRLSAGALVVRGLGCLVALLVAVLALAPAGASAALPEIEVRHMPEIEQWVYRNGAPKDPVPCGTVCADLWILEHHSLPGLSQAVLDGLGKLETTGTGLWDPFLGEKAAELQLALGSVNLIAGPLDVGWRISAGGGGVDKWMKLIGPTTEVVPSEAGWCPEPRAGLLQAGAWLKPTYHEKIVLSSESWAMNCMGQENEIANYSSETIGTCTAGSPHFGNFTNAGGGWTRQEWWNNDQYCGGELHSKTFAVGYTAPFRFGVPEDWSSQHLEGEGTHNVESNAASDPGVAAVKTATEHALETSTAFSTWVQEALELSVPSTEEELGSGNASTPHKPKCLLGKPVNCATGNQVETQADLAVAGRGPGLKLTRTYDSQLAAKQSSPGPFGYGWTGPYSAHLEVNEELGRATVYQDDGSTVRFLKSGEQWVPSGELVQATLVKEGSSYLYTPSDQTTLHFNSTGQLTSEADRNGNTLTMSYNAEKRLEAVTDPASRKLSLKYNSEGFVESAEDPMKHVVKYTYESKNLASVTQPGEVSLRWQFKYDASHQMTSETDGRSHAATTEYDSSHRVILQTDALERKRKWKYATTESGTETTITEPNGSETVEQFNIAGLPTSVTHASGTSLAATTTNEYDPTYNLIAVTDPNKHTTKYGYDAAGDRTSETDALERKTEWTYNGTHDVLTTTTPDKETTTIKRDTHGNPEVIERPAPGSTTQTTKYKYATHGEVESMEDPLKRVWKYEYNTQGDKTSETDPEGDKRTWEYNEDSQETATVSPRGHVKAGEEAKYTTKTERDSQGRPLTVTDPLGHKTKYAYDGDGNLETLTDANNNKTKYTYDADNERTKVEEPNKTITETGYDSAGQVTSQTDGSKHTTKYERNKLEEVTEVIDPRERKTIKEYDTAGNLTKVTDAAKRATTIAYDAANQRKEITYSDGKTPAVKYEYNGDGKLTHMTDGTGGTIYTYDELDRLTESKDGHGDKTGYEYDLANEQTKITYPNTKSVTRAFDKAGRLEKVTDWSEHITKFAYDADSDLSTTTFPTGTSNVDKYAYNFGDQMSEVKMTKSAETLASLLYTRDSDGQIKTVTSKGLPGEEKPAYEYDANSRLKKGGTIAYEYDTADNPTKLGTGAYKYDTANELETGPSLTYTYDELGERTKTKPASGPVTTYGYNQAGNLTSVERPKEGEVSEIKDTYVYDGNGLRASQAISGTTTYLAWDMTESLPLILSDEANSYVYGPGGLPVEQISSGGTVTYLHHDQQGSTRLLTGSTGTVTGSITFDAYGNKTGSTGTSTTPLGYAGQYTSSDTGLIYLRARVYDPATAQFLSVDPMVGLTRALYNYAGDNPLNHGDASGLSSWNPFSESFWTEGNVISESPLNPVPYYEKEIESYENGCGYLASVAHGLEGAVAGAALFAGGEGEGAALAEEGGAAIEAEIAGFTRHGLAQAISREGVGVNEQAMLDAVNAPMKVINQADGTKRFVGKDATVVLNGEGRVVTTWANGSAGTRIQP